MKSTTLYTQEIEKTKPLILIIFGLFIAFNSLGQEIENKNHNILRLNFITPGIEYEYSISEKAKISANIGVGLSMSFPNLTAIQPSHAFFVSPVFDLHYKSIYNSQKRTANNKSVGFNTGNFIGVKVTGRMKSIESELTRTSDSDFSIGPTWGMQRSFNKINFLFNVGPVYYFDSIGNAGFYPIMLELNIGYNIMVK